MCVVGGVGGDDGSNYVWGNRKGGACAYACACARASAHVLHVYLVFDFSFLFFGLCVLCVPFVLCVLCVLCVPCVRLFRLCVCACACAWVCGYVGASVWVWEVRGERVDEIISIENSTVSYSVSDLLP